MKASIVFMALTIAVVSCKKENDSRATIAGKFVGAWAIGEESQSNGRFDASVFNSTIFKVNDSTFGIIESNRTPLPMWIYWPNFVDYRTIHFQVDEVTREISSTQPHCVGKYSLNMDTIDFTFESTVLTTYYVRQRLVRK